MKPVKIAALALIVAGVLGLLYGTFTYTKETHRAQLGALELTMRDRETVNIPVWVGAGAVVVGGLLLFVPGKKS